MIAWLKRWRLKRRTGKLVYVADRSRIKGLCAQCDRPFVRDIMPGPEDFTICRPCWGEALLEGDRMPLWVRLSP